MRRKLNIAEVLIMMVFITVSLSGCGGGVTEEGTTSTTNTAVHNQWTWISGGNTANLAGNYGTKGTPMAANYPGSRYGSVSWMDASNNLWLFGGHGYAASGTLSDLNDLWKFDGTNWTWMSGGNLASQTGTYGTKGTPAAANIPGSRHGAVAWIDASNNLWLFGGQGLDSAGTLGSLNDLWKFNGINWTWMSGGNIVNQNGLYGIKNTPSIGTRPGSRYGSVSWTDASNNLWLFGGYGYDYASTSGELNDLWKFDGTNWTWMSGGNTANQRPTYGIKKNPAAANIPGSRHGAVSWIDTSNNLWLFGGRGYDSADIADFLNDLWKFDGANWTWMSGSNIGRQSGTYGSKGTPAAANVPGARFGAVSWKDANNNFWLFGGYGYDSVGTLGELNDLWKFDGNNWTWMSGENRANQTGTYGTKGAPGTANVAGSRYLTASWIDASNNLWLFGGYGYDSESAGSHLNDLWLYQP